MAWWANVECEDTACSVGPFQDKADADLFRSMMFCVPLGTSDERPASRMMTVSEFQDAFRADFLTRPPASWQAIF